MADFIPRRDSELVTWANQFAHNLASDPEAFGITLLQSDEVSAAVADFTQAFAIRSSASTGTRVSVTTKNDQRAKMKRIIRTIVRIIQANPNVTSPQKSRLGISTRTEYHRPVGLPEHPPLVTIKTNKLPSDRVQIQIRDRTRLAKSKPKGVVGAMIFMHIGRNLPATRADWKFVQNTTLTDCTVPLPAAHPIGTQVWIAVAWLDTLLNVGPWSSPAFTHIGTEIIGQFQKQRAA